MSTSAHYPYIRLSCLFEGFREIFALIGSFFLLRSLIIYYNRWVIKVSIRNQRMNKIFVDRVKTFFNHNYKLWFQIAYKLA